MESFVLEDLHFSTHWKEQSLQALLDVCNVDFSSFLKQAIVKVEECCLLLRIIDVVFSEDYYMENGER